MAVLKRLNSCYRKLCALRDLAKIPGDIRNLSDKVDMLFNEKFPNTGERQVQTQLEKIRIDHKVRYQTASKYIQRNDNVLDIACGVGYGSYIMAVNHSSANLTGMDISQKTIDFANKYYSRENIQYICGNCLKAPLQDGSFDVIVTYETVEHIDEDELFLTKLHKALKNTGTLILSTPNQDFLPFDKKQHPYHIKHYKKSEITDLLDQCGFEIKEVFGQPNSRSDKIFAGWKGMFNIIIAAKKAG